MRHGNDTNELGVVSFLPPIPGTLKAVSSLQLPGV